MEGSAFVVVLLVPIWLTLLVVWHKDGDFESSEMGLRLVEKKKLERAGSGWL